MDENGWMDIQILSMDLMLHENGFLISMRKNIGNLVDTRQVRRNRK